MSAVKTAGVKNWKVLGLKNFPPRALRLPLPPRVVSLLIVLLVFACAVTVRRLGMFQFLEFQLYDLFIQQAPKTATSEPIVIIEMTEADIQSPSLEWPLYDNILAELLTKLEADEPAVIGLDIWRDLPVPKSGIYLEQFNRVLKSNTNIVAIFTLDGIAPPPVLKSNPERLGFNDSFPVDIGVHSTTPKVRRYLLFATSGGQNFDSLGFRLTTLYLERRGIEPEFDATDPNVLRLGKSRLRAFEPNDGPYVGATAGDWQMLLDFRCSTNFTRYSMTAALSGQIPKGSLRDKIVLVGINAASVSDERVTPLRRDHRGIEVHALTINQLLRHALGGEKPLRFWHDWIEDAWLLLWCLAGGAVGYWIRSPLRFALIIVAGLFGLGFVAHLAFNAGWWIPVMAPALACAPAAALVTSYASFNEKRQRGQLMQLFSKQVSSDIAEAIWEQRDEFLAGQRPKSQKLMATLLFTDLRGFSATSEGLDPAELMDWLNEYMETMAGAIMAHRGVVEKYIGDGIMAVFGVPLARSTEREIREDAQNAVRCALAMKREMETLNVSWKERGLPACGMRVGIHTGMIVAGSLGSAERQEYTVIGDSVNTASRLESFDKDGTDPNAICRILISDMTLTLLEGKFETGRVGTISLRNKTESVMVHHVIAEIKP